MNSKDIRVICIGIGEMGKVGVQTILDHKIDIVAAIDINPDIIGKDVAEISGYPACGTKIEKDLASALDRTAPTVAFIASDPGMDSLYGMLMLLAKHKVNVVMTVMDTYYPLPHTKKQLDEIDAAFKENGVSVFSSGINDVWWSGIGMDIVGTCKKVEAIDFTNRLPLNDMGTGVARDFYVNRDPEEYMKIMSSIDMSTDESVSGPLMALYIDAEILGLHIKNVEIKAFPCIAAKDIPMPSWSMTVEKGKMSGDGFNIKMTTEEGIVLTTAMEVKVMSDEDIPGTSWTIKGEPDLHIELGDIHGEITTSSTAINRIPDVINARPGVITLADLTVRPTFHSGEWKEI